MSALTHQSAADLMFENGIGTNRAHAAEILAKWQKSSPQPTSEEMDFRERKWAKDSAAQLAADRGLMASTTKGAVLLAAIEARREAAQKPTAAFTPQRSTATPPKAKPAPRVSSDDGADIIALARQIGLAGVRPANDAQPADARQAEPPANDPDGADIIALARSIGLHGVRPAEESSRGTE